jgi:hypothetical protein
MFDKGNAMISMASIFLVLTLTIGAYSAFIDTSSSIVNPEPTHSRIKIIEKPLPDQKNVSVKMCQTQSKPLEKQGHTRFKKFSRLDHELRHAYQYLGKEKHCIAMSLEIIETN